MLKTALIVSAIAISMFMVGCKDDTSNSYGTPAPSSTVTSTPTSTPTPSNSMTK